MVLNVLKGFLFVLGICFPAAAAVVKCSLHKRKKTCTQIVRASIEEVNKMERSDSDGAPFVSYFPVYRYEYNGQTYHGCPNVGSARNIFKIGDEVNIHIDPNNPQKLYAEPSETKLIISIFVLLGICFLGTAIGLNFAI